MPGEFAQTDLFAGGGENILTVTELTAHLRAALEDRFPTVTVRGEISNLRLQPSGHCYFTLKDEGSQLPCVWFRQDMSRSGLRPGDGLRLIATGRISVYEPRGYYQLVIRHGLEDGQGRLQLAFERLKARLAAEGLFEASRKKPLPALPLCIGFVTSPAGAAVRDFISVLRRRAWKGRLIILPARVQGTGAAAEIAAQIELAGRWGLFDLLVVGRGGGSLEDLWPFNEEVVARALAACPIPTISAVGHEIDFTLSDFAADRRAETPSAAAELISSLYLESRDRLRAAREALARLAQSGIERRQMRLEIAGQRLRRHHPQIRLDNWRQRLDDLAGRLRLGLLTAVENRRQRLWRARARLAAGSPVQAAILAREQIRQLGKRLASASPESVLQRGFVILRKPDGTFATRAAGLSTGDRLEARFADGARRMRVEKIANVFESPPPD